MSEKFEPAVIAFDGDDTLWDNQIYYDAAEAKAIELVSPWMSEDEFKVRMLEIETRRVTLVGFGAASFSLSLIQLISETAPAAEAGELIREIISLGESIVTADYTPLKNAEKMVKRARRTTKTILITKGNPFEQNRKLSKNGFGSLFDEIEIVPDKTPEVYRKIARHHGFDLKDMMMVGNSIKSDIRPLIGLAGALFHIPYKTTWAFERAELTPEESANVVQLKQISELAPYF